jgi:prevent-host-death family protein
MHTIADAKNTLPRLVHQVELGEPVILSRHGKPVAVLQSYASYRHDQARLAQQPQKDWFTRTLEWRAGQTALSEGLTDAELDAARPRDRVPSDMDDLGLA